jgi:uncharacterized protein YceK
MKHTIVALAGAAVVVLTGCSQAATPPAAHTGNENASAGCAAQFNAWSHGQGKRVLTALDAVGSAQAGGDAKALTAALQQNKSVISWAASHPVPSCADTGSYWVPLMQHLTAAANTTSIATVQAAMKGVPQLAEHLTAELKAL